MLQVLRLRGVDIVTVFDAGMDKVSDAEQLVYAATQGRTLFSFNTGDFMSLHVAYMTEGKHHAGIIFSQQQRYSVGEQTRRLLKLIGAKSAEDMRNCFEFLSVWS